MQKITEAEAIALMRKYAPNEEVFNKVLGHVRAVQAIAIRISNEIVARRHEVDMHVIRIGSLLHDIGRFSCPPKTKENIKHGIKGAEILRKEGVDEKFALICERHIGAGIDVIDIEQQRLDLPKKDYMPLSIEEKIISYADNLVFGDKEGTVQMVVDRFRKEIGERAAQKAISQHNEIEELRGRKDFLKI